MGRPCIGERPMTPAKGCAGIASESGEATSGRSPTGPAGRYETRHVGHYKTAVAVRATRDR